MIADHVECAAPVVFEGDYLLPDLAVRFGGAVRAVVLDEADEHQLVANYRAREPHRGDQRQRAQVSIAVNAELARRATLVAVPVVAARPWNNLPDRADAALRGNLNRSP